MPITEELKNLIEDSKSENLSTFNIKAIVDEIRTKLSYKSVVKNTTNHYTKNYYKIKPQDYFISALEPIIYSLINMEIDTTDEKIFEKMLSFKIKLCVCSVF